MFIAAAFFFFGGLTWMLFVLYIVVGDGVKRI